MAVAALPPGKKSPIDSMRSNFRGLKNNIKSMSKTVLGIQTALQKANELKRKRLETLKENRLKQKDLQQKQAEEERLEKPNLMSSSFSNIKDSIKKSGGGILNCVLKIVGLFAGAWLFNNIDNIKDTIEKAVKVIQDVWTGISNFVSGTFDIVKGLAKTVLAFGKNIIELDFTDKSGRLKEAFSDVELGWKKLSGAITGAEETFDNPEKIEDEKESEDKDTDTDKEEKECGDETSGNGTSVKVDPLVVLDDNKELMKFWDKYPMVYIYGESDEHFWGANVHYMRPELRKYGFTPAAPPQTIHKYLRSNVRSSMLVVPDSEWDDIGQIPSEQFHITTFGRDTAVPTSVILKKGELV